MLITIKYFGQIAEVTQKNEEQIEISGGSISELLSTLITKYSDLKNKDFQIAQNQELVDLDTELTGAEIALLPPFAGG
ncbi:molybdopterin synthase subunit MoaD [Hyunsoonleella jejuensis]|uniref:Molybdopterin synthase subunit MoaD n=1 Tax=Hyunsoonleella jejuensis TaxID=419940 RepID=A0A1H9GXV2_9FLAO|nr:MoaD/ThiS family protein [Hyunsoonleella jejuensis]SEQ54956.1 molybdopterin synthase subunit MoaD [Hyunsoonleella jejuensis]